MIDIICCLNCEARSLLRTTCKGGSKQEWDKKSCKYYREIKKVEAEPQDRIDKIQNHFAEIRKINGEYFPGEKEELDLNCSKIS